MVVGRGGFEPSRSKRRVMSATMRHLSDVLPLTYAVRAIQQPWLGSAAKPLDLLLLAALLAAARASTTTWRTA